jgi:hypothetical protein
MSFLYPAMLAGLVGLAVPVILHLIARQRFPVQDFPSIRLLYGEKRSNVFAPKLVDVLQLLMRLLVLLLLVVAMARLFASGLSSRPAPRNLVVVVDCSASMREVSKAAEGAKAPLLRLAKEKARELLNEISPPSQCALVSAGAKTEVLSALQPSPQPAIGALDRLETTDGTGFGLVHAIATGCDMVRGRREHRSQIIVLTDLRASAFAARHQKDIQRIEQTQKDLGHRLEILLIDLSTGASDNVAIVDGRVRGGEVKVGDDAHVVATLANSSDKEQTATVRLAVAGQTAALSKKVTLGPRQKAVVDMTERVNRSIRTCADLWLQEQNDVLPYDDCFSVPLHVADARRVLIVNGSAQASASTDESKLSGLGATEEEGPQEETVDGAVILRFALNPGREFGLGYGTGIHATMVTPEALVGQPLSKYEVIVLYDVSSLSDQSLADLDAFVKQGQALLIICSGKTNAVKFNRTLGSGGKDRAPLSLARIGNERSVEPPLGILQSGTRHPLLAEFRDPLRGDLSVVRFTRIREVAGLSDDASVIFRGDGGHPLAIEMPRQQGRVLLLTFGLELDRGNIARTRVFPALAWRLIDYLTGRLKRRPPDVLSALSPGVLDVSEPAFGFADQLELTPAPKKSPQAEADTQEQEGKPEGEPLTLPIGKDRTVLVRGLKAGNYLLHKPRKAETAQLMSYVRHITVNPDPQESDTTEISGREMSRLLGPQARSLPLAQAVNLAPTGGEFWAFLVVLLALAYAAEAAVGWTLTARRERERLEGLEP